MRIRWPPVLAALAFVVTASAPFLDLPAGSAAPRAPRPGAGSSLEGDLEDATASEQVAIRQYDAAHAARADLDAAVRGLDAQVGAAQTRIDAADAEIGRIGGRLDALQRRIEENRAAMEAARATFVVYVRRLYQDSGDSSAVAFLDARSGGEWNSRNKYMKTVSQQQQEQLEHFSALRIETDDLKREQQQEQAAATRVRDAAALDRDRIARSRDAAAAKRAEAVVAEQTEAAVLTSIRARTAQFQAEVDRQRAEAARVAAEIRKRGSSGTGAPPKGNGRFRFPVQATITSPFGYRIHPSTHTRTLHEGIDFGAAMGAPIHAAGDGVVIFAGVKGGYGNATIIDHGNGVTTLYGHQSRLGVRAGQMVRGGDVIGFVGSTGNSTGPHLHFEVRVNGTPVDPLTYL